MAYAWPQEESDCWARPGLDASLSGQVLLAAPATSESSVVFGSGHREERAVGEDIPSCANCSSLFRKCKVFR